MARTILVSGRIVARTSGNSIKGYTVTATYDCAVSDLQDTALRSASVTAPVAASRPIEDDGSFRVEVQSPGDPIGPIVLKVKSPDRSESVEREIAADDIANPVTLKVEGYKPFVITAPETTSVQVPIRGRAIGKNGKTIPAGLGLILFGVDHVQGGEAGESRVIASGRTQADGYFSLPWVPDRFTSASAQIAGGDTIPIKLQDTGQLPLKVILVTESAPDAPVSSSSSATTPPRAPNPSDLTDNPAAFSQDLGGGCVNLSMPDRTIEEFSYFMVVRTTEPEVKGFTLNERPTVPPKLIGELIVAAATSDALAMRTVTPQQTNVLAGLSLDAIAASRILRGDRPPTLKELGRASWLSELDWAKDLLTATLQPPPVRTPADDGRPIRWDYNDTKIYQAVSIAHGHILQYREVWKADGYSLGDLLSSLPLAPGQRRQVAIVDWDRRSQAVREENLEFEEELQSVVSRDRDIREIVGSHLNEEMEAGSRNTTWGAAAGLGGGLIGGTFGIFGGVAGGASGSDSTAWQDSSRRFSGETMQNLRDRVTQRASSLRDQRSTVVQTVAQGETWRAETEVVANYNRCHTITVEYFQVLRHFVITHELAGVRECLFVPFTMRSFDVPKALRWRETLERFLRDKTLRPGFDAMQRVSDQWEGWDFPVARYSEEAPDSLEGELRISFVLPRPRDDQDEKFQINEWRHYAPFIPQDTYELWIANINGKQARERDAYFRANVAPIIAARLIAQLRFAYVTNTGTAIDLTLDGTLVSRYAEGTPLYVTLRPAGGLPPIPREQISAFQIRYDGADLPADARVIVHSGKVRYRTPNLTSLLFNEPRVLNDLRAGDPVTVSTPLTRAEACNPRQEDRDLAEKLVRHLNDNLEYYHQAIWASLDSERRFILLDGMLIPGSSGLSVASVVENRIIGIAGNSMILPLAPGIHLDPRISEKSTQLKDLYQVEPLPPLNISVPTRGVYAEAVQGNCTACEKIDDTRYWRWTTAGMLAPPPIAEVSTQRPSGTDPNLTPTPLPAPLVSIQNAPELPEPTSLASVLGLLAKPDLFRDVTGLAGTQANAQKAFNSAMTNMTAIGNDAATLAKQQLALPNTQRTLDRLQSAVNDGLLSQEDAQHFAEGALRSLIGAPADTKQLPTEDPAVKKAVEAAAQSKKAEVKVTTADETVEAKFEDTGTRIGAAGTFTTMPVVEEFIDQEFIVEVPRKFSGQPAVRNVFVVRLPRYSDAAAVQGARAAGGDPSAYPIDDVDPRFVKKNGDSYRVMRRLRIVFPADATDPKKVAGTGRLPVVAMIHGHHGFWLQNQATDTHPGEKGASFEGYDYLQEHLAEQEIVSVSVDTNAANYIGSMFEMRAEILLNGLDRLRELDKNNKSPLFGRLDFNNVGLMGHSRGGDAVVRAALKNNSRGENKFGIKAVCSLAPTDFTGTATIVGFSNDVREFRLDQLPNTFQDGPLALHDNGLVSYLVVYGALDGDVHGDGGALSDFGTGFRHYDRATCPKAMVFLHHCDHNRFNTVWKSETSGRDESGVSIDDRGPQGRLLSEDDHRTLAREYIGGFMRWRLKGEEPLSGLFNGSSTNSLNAQTTLQWSFGKKIKGIDNLEDPVRAPIGSRIIMQGVVDQFANLTINNLKIAPRIQHQTGVLAVNPNLADPTPSVLRIDFADPNDQDWSQFDVLTLRVAADFDLTDETTITNGRLPEFSIVLMNASVSARLDQTNFSPALSGPVFHRLANGTNVTTLKLQTVRVPLSSFQGVTLSQINALEIHPGPNFSAHMFFDSIQLFKER